MGQPIHGIFSEEFKPESLLIIFKDGTRLLIDSQEVRKCGYEFFDDPRHVPDEIKKAAGFQRCSVCPYAHTQGYCHALLPMVSFLEKIDQYPSFEPVTVVFRDQISDSNIFKETTLQVALQYVSILSLIHYCELGRTYRDIFLMVSPIMEPRHVAARIYLNLFWQLRGDEKKIAEYLKKFVENTTGDH